MDETQTGSNAPEHSMRLAAEVLSGKWTALIVHELLLGVKRFSELQTALSGISPKVLAQRLRMLEKRGLLTRKIYPTVPLRTEYRLTRLGRGMKPVIRAMEGFGQTLAETRDAPEERQGRLAL